MRHVAPISLLPSARCAYFLSPRGCTFWGPLCFHLDGLSVPMWQILCSQQLAASCTLLAFFFALRSFVFSGLQTLFQKQGGRGQSNLPTVRLAVHSSSGQLAAARIHT